MGIHIHGHESPVPVPEQELEPKPENKNIVKALYKALPRGNSEIVAQLLASDHLEWRYHGPPNCHHMMLMLTGKSTRHRDHHPFRFKPRSIKAVGELVIAEGWEESEEAYWVHVWTIKDGKITQFREYFNTWLTVLLQAPEAGEEKNVKLWQSEPQLRLHRSLPDLMLAVII